MTDNIKQLPPPNFKSQEAVVELIRGMLDISKDEVITYLEINYKIKNERTFKSKSIVTSNELC